MNVVVFCRRCATVMDVHFFLANCVIACDIENVSARIYLDIFIIRIPLISPANCFGSLRETKYASETVHF